MQVYLLINTLFKTAEYKLEDSESLKITELSLSGARSKKILLNSIKKEEGQSISSLVSYLIFLFGCFLIISAYIFSQYSPLLSNNLMSLVFFLASSTVAATLLTRPVKTHNYRDIYSNHNLLQISQSSMINNATDNFVKDLNNAIEKAKTEESNKINLKKNSKLEYENHSKNVDDLFNLGLIDEALYNRICNSMHEKVFGTLQNQVTTNNVIYLNK